MFAHLPPRARKETIQVNPVTSIATRPAVTYHLLSGGLCTVALPVPLGGEVYSVACTFTHRAIGGGHCALLPSLVLDPEPESVCSTLLVAERALELLASLLRKAVVAHDRNDATFWLASYGAVVRWAQDFGEAARVDQA